MELNIDKIKEQSLSILSQYKKPLFIISLGVVSIILLVIAFNSYGKDYVVEIINNFVKEQMEIIDSNYAEQLKTRDNQIQNLQKRLTDSEKTYTDLKKRVGDVEINISNRKVPTTPTELRDRFDKLSYKPVECK